MSSWFVPFKFNQNSHIRLFCFHYGGGSASAYQGWAKDLIDHVDLIAIQLPGRESRFSEPLLHNLPDVVDALSLNFRTCLDKPYIFFGHSIGALISFELTRTLRKEGMQQPERLVVSGTKAPQVPPKESPIHHLPDPELIEKIRAYNGTPSDIIENKELMDIYLPIIRADFCISETYSYHSEPPLSCPIIALGGLDDDTFDSQNLLKWKEQTSAVFQYELLPGDHFFIKSAYQKVIGIVNKILYKEVEQLTTRN
jgi:medium-chain acyl-[acyl-carrier-protein] hydrolase